MGQKWSKMVKNVQKCPKMVKNLPQVQMFSQKCVKYESFNKQGNGNDIKDENVKNVLAIFLQIIRESVPFFH